MFDWISPLFAWIQDLIHGPGFTFTISGGTGLTGHQMERVLRRAGCRTWGAMIVWPEDVYMVTVPQDQAQRGYKALLAAGVVPDQIPDRRPKRSGLLDDLLDVVDLGF